MLTFSCLHRVYALCLEFFQLKFETMRRIWIRGATRRFSFANDLLIENYRSGKELEYFSTIVSWYSYLMVILPGVSSCALVQVCSRSTHRRLRHSTALHGNGAASRGATTVSAVTVLTTLHGATIGRMATPTVALGSNWQPSYTPKRHVCTETTCKTIPVLKRAFESDATSIRWTSASDCKRSLTSMSSKLVSDLNWALTFELEKICMSASNPIWNPPSTSRGLSSGIFPPMRGQVEFRLGIHFYWHNLAVARHTPAQVEWFATLQTTCISSRTTPQSSFQLSAYSNVMINMRGFCVSLLKNNQLIKEKQKLATTLLNNILINSISTIICVYKANLSNY